MKTHEMFPSLKGKTGKTAVGAKSKQVLEVEFRQAGPEDSAFLREALKRTGAEDFLRLQELIMKAVASGKFRKWSPEQVARKHIAANKQPADEKHYSPSELANAWDLSADTIRALFENESGVLIVGDAKGTRKKRRYRTIKIPLSVAVRVKNRLSARPAPVGKGAR